jgi:uncharacterized phage protein gp47/JayE
MSIPNPSIATIRDNIIVRMESEFNTRISLIPKSFLHVLATVLAGVFVVLYKYNNYAFKQQFVSTASNRTTTIGNVEFKPLTEWGRLIGVGDIGAATYASCTVEITVTNETGSLPVGTQLLRSDTGVLYLTLATVALDAATVTVDVQAVGSNVGGDGSGSIGNVDVGTELSFLNPLANVDRVVTVTDVLTTAVNGETEAEYRQRVIDRFQQKPQGGALADYAQWAEEVVGIINAYPYTGDPGEVNVYVEANVESSGDPDGIPSGVQLGHVVDSINFDQTGLPSRRPANAFVNVYPITRATIDVVVTGLNVSDTVSVETQITTALEDYFKAAEPYIDGLALPPRKDRITQAAVSQVVSEVAANANGFFDSITVSEGGSPVTIRQLLEGEKCKLGTVTFA